MYKKMSYRTAREIGPLVEELINTQPLYDAYVYKMLNERFHTEDPIVGSKEYEIKSNFNFASALKELIVSREEIISYKLNVKRVNIHDYVKFFGFKNIRDMTQLIGDIKLSIVSDEEILSINKRVIGVPMSKQDLNMEIKKLTESLLKKSKNKN